MIGAVFEALLEMVIKMLASVMIDVGAGMLDDVEIISVIALDLAVGASYAFDVLTDAALYVLMDTLTGPLPGIAVGVLVDAKAGVLAAVTIDFDLVILVEQPSLLA